MFTGIIEFMGRVRSLSPTAGGSRLVVDPLALPPGREPPRPGDSVAIQGCCLTLVASEHPERGWAFDVVPETLGKTTLGAWVPGRRVNMELSATLGTLMGGHMVQGHVDGVGVVEHVRSDEEFRLAVRPPTGLMQYLIPKGSIAIDGVSLTVASVDPGGGVFEVALIPATLERTTLSEAAARSPCNLECDVMAKTIVHWLAHYAASGARGPNPGSTPAR